jgi:hypothetical protein
MENDVKKELDDLTKNLRIIESELTWQLDKLKDYMKRDNENDMESHLKIADINASIELLQEQIKSQAEIFTSNSNKQSSSTSNLKKSIEDISKTTNLLQQHFEFQKNKLSEYIERDSEFTKQFGDTLRKMRDDMKTITYSKSIVDTLNVASQKDDVDSLKKKDVYRKEKLLHLEKKLENTHTNMKKRVSELENKIKKLES